MNGEDLTRFLDGKGVEYELLKHPRTESAADEARALGVDPEEIAKTLVLTSRSGHVRVLVPASRRLDLRKVRNVLGNGKHVRLTTEDELERDYSEFELGAVPPVGGRRPDALIVDDELARRESLVFEAGRHDRSLLLRTDDLLRVADARVADVSVE